MHTTYQEAQNSFPLFEIDDRWDVWTYILLDEQSLYSIGMKRLKRYGWAHDVLSYSLENKTTLIPMPSWVEGVLS